MDGELGNRLRDQAVRVFDYLADLARLRTKQIRDVRQYEHVYWFDTLPNDPSCFTVAWGQIEEHGDDIWLEIKKRPEPKCPPPPIECREWVDEKTLLDSDEEPELRPSILVETPRASETDDIQATFNREPEYKHLKEYPAVQHAWARYVDSRWKPWSEQHRKWKEVQDSYSELFTIHQAMQRLGEEYELVLGLGFLVWKPSSRDPIARHVLTAQASLEFDAAQGVFRVTAAAEGAHLRLETDMLLPNERPAPSQQKTIEESLKAASESPWDQETIEPALRAWVRSLDHRGEYDESLTRPQTATDAPRIHLAPALILRRRTAQTVLSAIERVIRSLQEGGDVPVEIIRLVVDPDEFDKYSGEPQSDNGKQNGGAALQDIYFPLPTNGEQRQIIETLQGRRGVLVQGPPGTGKSHTIANLICHLLATDHRVLVTAQTPRALRVLKDKLPPDIRPLCVSVLGNDRAALLNLEESVSIISRRYACWDAERNRKRVEQLRQQLHESRKQAAKLEADLRAVREKETRKHEVAGGAYKGTAQQIARRLTQEASQHAWFPDELPCDAELPSSPETLAALRSAFIEINANREAELRQQYPSIDDIPGPDTLRELVEAERRARAASDAFQAARSRAYFEPLVNGDPRAVDAFADAVKKLRVATQNIERRPLNWISHAIYGMLTDQDTPWKSLKRATVEDLAGLRDRAYAVDQCSLVIPDSAPSDRDQLLADASDLKAHFDKGGGKGWLLFAPSIVRRTKYLSQVRLDGRPCDRPDTLGRLIDVLQVQKTLERLWKTWSDKADRVDGSFTLQVSELEEHLEALEAVLALEEKLEAAKAACHAVEGLGEPPWHNPEALDDILKAHEAIKNQRALLAVQQKLQNIEEMLTGHALSLRAHPVCSRLAEAVRNRDVEAYVPAWETVKILTADAQALEQRRRRYEQLHTVAPRFAESLAQTASDEVWEVRLSTVAEAWNWARASSWLEEYLRPKRETDLEAQLIEINQEIGRHTASLAAALAWQHFFDRMSEGERQHLMAWQQAMKKIGKGTGKYAAKHRRDAQAHLDKCRNAIPAWIMPLYRIFETVSPEPEMFDVLIVDEASQCGPDALLLLYLAKKIIIVGDDQQISPEAVGINQGDVDQLIRQHLADIEHADAFGVTSSLFDHGAIRYGNRIVLREHFRCMPEIIRFSNDLCYKTAPLIPLRQYPPCRLRPVVTHYVQEGYREGGPSRAFNRPEAEAVVRAVVACCADPHYEGKTMGIISLQGNAQARLIETMLLEELEATEIEERRIICGDAYSFQGDERDVMFLSMIAAPNARIGPLTKESDKRRFNVAASRARDQMWLFHSVKLEELSQRCLRYELLRYCQNPTTQHITCEGLNIDELRIEARETAKRNRGKPPRPFESWFELDVFLHIVGKGYRVIPQYRVAGYRIDLVVEGTVARLAVECDGDEFHGIERYQEDRARQLALERCGWHFWRVRGSEYYRDPEAAMASLWELLAARGIESASEQFVESGEVDGYVPEVDWDASRNAGQASRRDGPGNEVETSDEQKRSATERPSEAWRPRKSNMRRLGRTSSAPRPMGSSTAAKDEDTDHHVQEASAGFEKGGGPMPVSMRKTSRQPVKIQIPEARALIDEASGIEAEVWFSLARWAKDNNLLEGRDRRMMYNMGLYKKREQPLTFKQARYALRLLREAKRAGFEHPLLG